MTLLQLHQVSRRYGGIHALHELTLTVPAGARHAVIGPNGAGKTTLLHLIAGTLRPTTGRIWFDGRDITGVPRSTRARRGIGRTFQHPGLVEHLTATANIELARIGGTRTEQGRDGTTHTTTTDALLGQAGLAQHAHCRTGDLPYGLRRRLETAVALAARPRLLLLDEPSAGLGPDDITWLTDTIHTLPTSVTVILVDHHLDLVFELADTVTVLHHGRHLTTGAPDHIRTHPDVKAAYLGAGPTGRPKPAPTPAGSSQPVLRVRHLDTGYHGTPILHDITLDAARGEVLGILGRNGAGKTTLLNTIAGLLPTAPDSSIDLAGTRIPAHQPGRAAHAGIALVPQDRRLFTTLTVAEHLRLAARTRLKRPTPRRRWDSTDVLTLFPALHDRLRHRTHHLSGGEQQMLAIARALLANPRVLLLDEPGEGLAPALLDQFTTAIAHIAGQGVTILLTEHPPDLTSRLAHRLLVLDRGRIALHTPHTGLSQPDTRTPLDDLLGVTAGGR